MLLCTLSRWEPSREVGWFLYLQHSHCCPDFNGVAQWSARAVHLQHPNAAGCHIPAHQGGPDECLLGRAVWCGEAAAAPILVDIAAAHGNHDRQGALTLTACL